MESSLVGRSDPWLRIVRITPTFGEAYMLNRSGADVRFKAFAPEHTVSLRPSEHLVDAAPIFRVGRRSGIQHYPPAL
jgi:hypothetical protein